MSQEYAPRIIRSKRRMSIGIRITPTGEVIVSAPGFLPLFAIHAFLRQKDDWIKTQRAKMGVTKAKTFQEGERIWYLGKRYTITTGNVRIATVTDTQIVFPSAVAFRLKKELNDWYKLEAKTLITRRLLFHAQQMQVSYASVMFSDTSSKWGTCTHDNRLQFSWRLIMAPLPVIDYVIVHELAHISHKNHSISFWKRVAQFSPAYRQHRKWLSTHQGEILAGMVYSKHGRYTEEERY